MSIYLQVAVLHKLQYHLAYDTPVRPRKHNPNPKCRQLARSLFSQSPTALRKHLAIQTARQTARQSQSRQHPASRRA